MGGSVRPEIDPLEALKAMKAKAPAVDPLEQLKATKSAVPTRYDGSPATAGVIPSALDGATFGLSQKGVAGLDALGDAVKAKLHGGDFSDTLGKAYRQNLTAQEAAAQRYHEAHPVIDTASNLAGAAGTIAATGGLGSGDAAMNTGRLMRYAKTIGTGATYGTAAGAGHSDALEQGKGATGLLSDAARGGLYGAAAGAVSIPASALGGKLLSALHVPEAVSGVAGAVSRMVPEGSPIQRAAQGISGAFGEQGPASQQIAKLAEQDRKGGFVPNDAPKSVRLPLNRNLPRNLGEPMQGVQTTPRNIQADFSDAGSQPVTDMAIPATPGSKRMPDLSKFKPAPLALDNAGPNVQGWAEAVANRPGEAGARIQTALKGRLAPMRQNVSGALADATGVPANARLSPLQQMIDARTAEAKTLYDQARAETTGQAITSPTFEAIAQTKAGAHALKAAMQRQGNMFHEAPMAGGTPPGMSPEQWQGFQETMKARGQPMPPGLAVSGDTPQADPETLHIMKQQLTKMAKLGSPNDPLTAEAFSLLPMIEKVKGELPASWQKADAAFADRSKLIDMYDRGRQVLGVPLNPTGATGQKAVNVSLDGLKAKMAAASPEQQQALQTGAATALHADFAKPGRSLKSPGRVFDFASPQKAEQIGYAFPTPTHADEFKNVVGAWDKAEAQKETMLGNSATARRGAFQSGGDILKPGAIAARSPRMVLRSLINNIDDEYTAGQRAKMEAEAAKILTSPDLKAIPQAAQAGVIRSRLLQAIHFGTAGEAGASAGAKAPQ